MPGQSRKTAQVVRSDSGDAHRLSLSARVLSTAATQVKAKAAAAEALLTSLKTTVEACNMGATHARCKRLELHRRPVDNGPIAWPRIELDLFRSMACRANGMTSSETSFAIIPGCYLMQSLSLKR